MSDNRGVAGQDERSAAGQKLARTLAGAADRTGAVVIGIPKGGAVVGARVALELGVAYECVPVCRIAMPCFPGLTLGAIDPDGVATFDPHTQLTQHELTRSGGELADRLGEHVERCRGDRTPIDLAGRDLIVIDDAAETHLVAQAAAAYLRRHGAARLVFATPAAVDDTVPQLRQHYQEVVAVKTLRRSDIESFYSDGVPSDDEVHECMARAWDASPGEGRAEQG
jgi:putative phosphoribosyl transferase